MTCRRESGQMVCDALDDLESDIRCCDDLQASLPKFPKTPKMTIKNTFIMDVEAASSEEEDELPPMLATRSCPAMPRQFDEPWKLSVAAIEERSDCDDSSEAEGGCDLMLPMRVTRTFSDFSDAPLPMLVTRTYSDFSEASVVVAMIGSLEYDLDLTPCSPCLRGGAVDFGVDTTSQNGPPGVWSHAAPMATLKVKNTFIDGYSEKDEDDDLDGIPMVASRSCPVPSVSFPVQGNPSVGFDPFFLNAVAQEMRLRSMAFAFPWAVPQPAVFPIVPEASRQSSEASDSNGEPLVPAELPVAPTASQKSSKTTSDSDGETVSTEAGTQAAIAVIAHLEKREPEWSSGSQAHGTGECRPCAWYWREQGCLNAAECMHCHLCPRDAIKARRKARQCRKQEQKQQEERGCA